MKRSKRTALIITAVVLTPLLLLWISWGGGLVPQVMLLNRALNEDPVLAQYPYKFRAVLLASGVATLTRPYDTQVPLTQFLAVLDPEQFADKAPSDPAVTAAIDEFRKYEMRAVQVALTHPEADAVDWVLDRAWYHKQGAPLPPKIGP